ncbi:hypothetical protein J4437_08375 [Candidatus Woesearchaeota archaeon]|nr:hypothetical protein [Candidatus Woesearchaeota archaeon]
MKESRITPFGIKTIVDKIDERVRKAIQAMSDDELETEYGKVTAEARQQVRTFKDKDGNSIADNSAINIEYLVYSAAHTSKQTSYEFLRGAVIEAEHEKIFNKTSAKDCILFINYYANFANDLEVLLQYAKRKLEGKPF